MFELECIHTPLKKKLIQFISYCCSPFHSEITVMPDILSVTTYLLQTIPRLLNDNFHPRGFKGILLNNVLLFME